MELYNSVTENSLDSIFPHSFKEKENNGHEIILKIEALRKLLFGVHTSESDEGHWTKPIDRRSVCREIIAICKDALKIQNSELIIIGYCIESQIYLNGYEGLVDGLTLLKNHCTDLFADEVKSLSINYIHSLIAINRIAAKQVAMLQKKIPLMPNEIEHCNILLKEISELIPETKDGKDKQDEQILEIFKELKESLSSTRSPNRQFQTQTSHPIENENRNFKASRPTNNPNSSPATFSRADAYVFTEYAFQILDPQSWGSVLLQEALKIKSMSIKESFIEMYDFVTKYKALLEPVFSDKKLIDSFFDQFEEKK